MSIRLVKISQCHECPYTDYNLRVHKLYCTLTKELIEDSTKINDDCPLEEVK